MELKAFETTLSVCKINQVADAVLEQPLTFLAINADETSLVCPVDCVPENAIEREDGWRAFRIEGELDFSLIGILAKISDILARAKIGIFALSTYNTDYILVKEEHFDSAKEALLAEGYTFKA